MCRKKILKLTFINFEKLTRKENSRLYLFFTVFHHIYVDFLYSDDKQNDAALYYSKFYYIYKVITLVITTLKLTKLQRLAR